MEISDSDEDDCLLYTKTSKHFTTTRNEIQAKRRELEEIVDLDLVPGDTELIPLTDEYITNRARCQDNKSPSDLDISFDIIQDPFDSEDDIPLAEVSRNLKRCRKQNMSHPPPIQRGRKRKSRKETSNESSGPRPTSQVRNLGVIVLDDDSGYAVDSFPPIDFNSRRSHKKSTLSNETSIPNINLDLEDEETFENNDLITLTIEWNNGKNTSRKEFEVRRYQKLQSVFEELAKLENINTNRVLIMYDFKSVSPMDTPSSLNLKFYGALIGSISTKEIDYTKLNIDNDRDADQLSASNEGIQVKLLLQSKQSLVFKVLKHQKMDILYQKSAEELKCEKSKLKITFDGEHVLPSELVSDLDIEDGDVFHVHVKDL